MEGDSVYCQQCGRELPAGSVTCPSCHSRVGGFAASDISLDAVVIEVRRAAKELAAASSQLAQHVAAKADRAAKDPSGSAKRGARRVAKELDKVRAEIEKILHDL